MALLNLYWTVLVLAFFALVQVEGQIIYVPGKPCVANSDCDTSSTHLECDLPTLQCRCQGVSYTVFDYDDAVCKLKAYQVCDPAPSADWKCTTNANCFNSTNTEFTCECPLQLGFVVTGTGKCVKKLGNICEQAPPHQCDRDEFLNCLSGTCKCNTGSYFENSTQECRILVPNSCEITAQNYTESCQPFAICNESNKCACAAGFTLVNNKCVHGYGERCETNPVDSCNATAFLTCSSKWTCDCFDPLTQYYDKAEGVCKIKADALCSNSSGTPPCTEYSVCTIGSGGAPACRCDPDLTVSKYQKCVQVYGSECIRGQDDKCDGDSFHECDLQNKCVCKNAAVSWYDPASNDCFLLAGASCTPLDESPSSQRCIPNRSDCVNNTCTCKGALLPGMNRTCSFLHGEICSTTSTDYCDITSFLACNPVTSRCECSNTNSAVYDRTSNSCKIKAENPCSVKPGQQGCVALSSCTSSPVGGSYCFCETGLSPSVRGYCRRQYDETCFSINHSCDEDAYQQCNPETGRCSCGAEMEYNFGDRVCYATLGNPCSTASALCKTGLVCINNTCACDSQLGFVDDGTGNCKKTIGIGCSTSTECNSYQFLECRNATCQCKGSYTTIQDAGGKRCVGLLNAPCMQQSDCYLNNSIDCNIQRGVCSCYDPLIQDYEDWNLRCVSRPGQRCHATFNLGSDTARLECSQGYECIAYDAIYGTCGCDYTSLVPGKCSGASTVLESMVLVLGLALLHTFNSVN